MEQQLENTHTSFDVLVL